MARPKIKKLISTFLAAIDIREGIVLNTSDVLVNGHRGYMSLNEDDLIKLFYKAKEKVHSTEFCEKVERSISRWTKEEDAQGERVHYKEWAAKIEAETVEKFLFYD